MSAQAVLSRPVLTLNRNWQPIQTTTVKDAIVLVAKGSAVIIDPETYEVHDLETWDDVSKAKGKFEKRMVRSAHLSLAPPEVIRLTNYGDLAERSVVFSRRNIFKRDKFCCQYCGKQMATQDLTLDHVMPRSRGGESSWENTVLACIDCNKMKADRTPKEAGMTLKGVPKKPTWKMLAQVPPSMRRESWEKFLSRAYWEIELEP
jgi:5-methylcytosine-specific restriction endonuclease McrA